jgi:hypothetical protein
MNKVAKVFLIGCGSIVALGVIVVVGIALYLKSHGSEIIAEGQAMRQQGFEAGAKLGDGACVDAALGRMGTSPGFGEALDSRLWLDGCLEASDPGAAICAGVPPETEIMKSVNWRLEECQARGRPNDNACSNLLASVQSYCRDRAAAPGG